MKLKYLHDKDSWMLGEEIPDMDLFFAQIWLSCFSNEFKSYAGRPYRKVLTIFRGIHLWFYYGTNDAKEVGDLIVRKIIKNPKIAKKINREIVRWSDKLRHYAETIPEAGLDRLSNKKLWDIYYQHKIIHTKYYQWGWMPVAADMFHNNLTNRLKGYLRENDVPKDKLNEYLVLLTTPTKKSLHQIEEEDFLNIAVTIYCSSKQKKIIRDLYKNFEEKEAAPYGLKTHTKEYEKLLEQRSSELISSLDKRILRRIQNHYLKYFYVKFLWTGKDGIDTLESYLKKIVKYIGRTSNPIKQLREMKAERLALLKKRKKLIKRLGIKYPWRKVIDEWGGFMVTKIYRRFAQIYAIFRMQPILDEIARRLKLPKKVLHLMLWFEVRDGLLKNKLNRKELLKRPKSLFVYYVERGIEKIITGKKAKNLAKEAQKVDIKDTNIIKGQTGCIGRAKGIVKKIIRASDMAKMKKGDILVSIATDPDVVPAMKKAAAIITEQGGVTSHAAIVSRELNIPCVIGTKIATKVLKDGDRVEVDATKGVVRKI